MNKPAMDERSFWVCLMFRIGIEFAGLPVRRYQYFWCDGFQPEQYLLHGPSPRIIGVCWICNGQLQDLWQFALLLPRAFASREEIDWSALYPPHGMTCWMGFDEDRRYLEIEPAAAVPDLG